MKRFMNKKLLVVGVAVALVIGVGGAAFAYFSTTGGGTGNAYVGSGATVSISQDTPNAQVVYDSLNSPVYPDFWGLNQPSTGFAELGNEINLAPASSPLSSVVVELDSQACQNWTAVTAATAAGTTPPPCTTTPGATFTSVPITLNIFNAPAAGSTTPGSLIAQATQSFTVPYRPSAASVASPGYCATGTNWSGFNNDGTQWYDATNGQCYYGIDYAATFNQFTFTGSNVLPSTVVYGISLNPSGPSDSLNVEESIEPTSVTVGSDTDPGNVFLADTSVGASCEITNETVGTTFEQYSTAVDPTTGCGETTSLGTPATQTWFVPAVEFNASANNSINLVPGGPGQSVDFTITDNSSTTPAYIQAVTVGITPSSLPNGCNAAWFTIVQPSSPLDVTIPAGGSANYQPSGGSISLINEPVNQDACQGANLGLTFTAS